ncbi:MAG: hypothetical protein NC299_05080 [Lachnospiraceae bacterium]|nr:hypothetical protein [Ruminococcus sp.]MCM1274724.1 hypothetical protein [Lachnospiraceae bacterium]
MFMRKEDRKIDENAPPLRIRGLSCGHMQIRANSLGAYEEMVSGVDHAGGVDIRVGFKNRRNKVIKYVTFTFSAYNAVDDKVPCTVRNSFEAVGKFTGPLNPGEYSPVEQYFGKMFYNHSITKVTIDKAVIEYMDGTVDEQTDF